MSTTSVFALTRANGGGSTVGALLAPSDLLISASSKQIGPSDVPGSTFTTSVAQIGQQLALADGNTGTVIDVSSTGNYALLHLASPEGATPLALSSAPLNSGQPILVSDGTSSYTAAISNQNSSDLYINAPSGTGPSYQAVFLSSDGGTFLGLGTNDEFDRTGHIISGSLISGNTADVATIQQWLAADSAASTQPTTPVVTNPPTTQPQPADGFGRYGNALIYDTTTQAYVQDTFSHPYSGPVAGVKFELVDITTDSLNLGPMSDSMFVKTGSGNDAIQLHGGTNVANCGAGSNFVTCADGFDTIFLDSRNVPSAASAAGPVPGAIWNTVENFQGGDAATLLGVGPGARLSWAQNEGAVGHTGLTLHATKQNGSTASLTLAGIDNGSHLQLSFGQTGGANYLYIKSV